MNWSVYIGDENPLSSHTWNLTPMWVLSGVVDGSLSELSGLTGGEVWDRVERALKVARRYPEAFRAVEPENGWGTYEGFIEALERVGVAALVDPTALTEVL